MEDNIKCELIGGGSPRHLKCSSIAVHKVVHYKVIRTLCTNLVAIVDLHPCTWGQLEPHSWTW